MLFFDYPACWHIWLWHHIRLWHIWQCLTTKFLVQITEYASWDNHTAAMSRHVNGLISYICSLDPSCCQNYKHKPSRCQNYSTLLWHWRDSVSESLYMLPCRSTKDCNYVISTIFRPNAEECSKAYTNEHEGLLIFLQQNDINSIKPNFLFDAEALKNSLYLSAYKDRDMAFAPCACKFMKGWCNSFGQQAQELP